MNTASSWVKRLGVGGQLAPFFKSVCVYFVAQCAGGDTPSLRAAALKCAPVLCLLAAVAYRCATLPPHKRRYSALVCAGLALSCCGDALLVWEGGLAAGMLAFGGAHVAYIAAFGRARGPCWRGAALVPAAALYARALEPRGAVGALVAPYALLVACMAWRGAAAGGAAAAGALLFLFSDAALAYDLFRAPLPLRALLVMPAYYLGQLGIAYSALRHDELAHAPAAAQ